jgi:hypothetical protein
MVERQTDKVPFGDFLCDCCPQDRPQVGQNGRIASTSYLRADRVRGLIGRVAKSIPQAVSKE